MRLSTCLVLGLWAAGIGCSSQQREFGEVREEGPGGEPATDGLPLRAGSDAGGLVGESTGGAGGADFGGTTSSAGQTMNGGAAGSGAEAGPCSLDEQCVRAPAGWQGPIVLLSGTEQSPPRCPASAPRSSFLAFADLQAAEPTCGCACSSVPVSEQSCGPVAVGLGSAPCSATPELVRVSAQDDTCTQFAGSLSPSGQYQFVDVGGSTWSAKVGCTPQPKANVPEHTWNEWYSGCELPTACEASGKCASEVDGADQLCVFTEGELTECPPSFPNLIPTWSDVDDTRACSACLCGSPNGSCSGDVALRESDCGAFRAVLVTLSINTCHAAPTVAALAGETQLGAVAKFTPSGGACTATTSMPTGSVQKIGPRTVCCR